MVLLEPGGWVYLRLETPQAKEWIYSVTRTPSVELFFWTPLTSEINLLYMSLRGVVQMHPYIGIVFRQT